MRIFVIGYMASGKTRLARRFANALGKTFIDLDMLVLEKTQKSPAEWIVEYGEDKFRQIEHSLLRNSLNSKNFVMATGCGTPCFFDTIDILNESGITIWLNTNIGKIIQRLQNRKGNRPLVPIKDNLIDGEAVRQHFNKRVEFYSKANIIVENNNVLELIEKIKEFTDDKNQL